MAEREKNMRYPEFQEKYIKLVTGDVWEMLADQKEGFSSFIDSLDEDLLNHRYAEDKWSVRQVILHIIDTEQIFNYRALCTHRGDKGPLPGFDHELYIEGTDISNFTEEYLSNYFTITRYNSLILFKGIKGDGWKSMARIDDYEMSLEAFPFMAAGHLQHHWNILKDRYLDT